MKLDIQLANLNQLRSAISRALGVGVLCAGISVAHADPELQQGSSVGEVSLVLGKAYVISEGEKPRLLKAGSIINVNDQVTTEANGHVHIRFVDNALVSVRPDSRLEILDYRYDAAHPEQSSVKLNLLEGVTRAISGNAAKSARERFRMNTPIAAIGVRGTDFVVSASDQSVRALVNEGAIVMAPYSSECLQAAYGPCASNAVELSQSSMQVVELASETSLPHLVAVSDGGADIDRNTVEVEASDSDDKAEDVEVYSETVASRQVSEAVLLASTDTVVPTPEPEPELPPTVVAGSDFTPEMPVVADVLTARQLVWGRWSEDLGLGAAERITLTVAEAEQDRTVAIYSSDIVYGLYREGDAERVQPNLGVVSFGLSSAQAFYHSGSGVMAMEVNDGSLELDFVANRFSTGLNLSSETTGNVGFSAAGLIRDGGYFYNNSDTQEIRGAVSTDGTESGYFFKKQVNDGTVQGLTLWDAN